MQLGRGSIGSLHPLQAELLQINHQPSGQEVRNKIQVRVRAFMTSDRNDVAERRRSNNWFLSLGVGVTVQDPKLSRLKWGTTDTVIYRDQAGRVVSDETLSDMAVLGFNKEDIARRKTEIRDILPKGRVE